MSQRARVLAHSEYAGGLMEEQPKCYRCGREPSQQLKNGEYWCAWCGQAFNPNDAETYREQERQRKAAAEKSVQRPRFVCDGCGKVVLPFYRRGDKYLFRGWRCVRCGRMLCEQCRSPVLAQPCMCGETRFESIELQSTDSQPTTHGKQVQKRLPWWRRVFHK